MAPRRLGLPASARSGSRGPRDVVERDGPHGPAAVLVGFVAEAAAPTHQRARAVGRVQLVRRHGDGVEVLVVVVGTHVDRPVTGQLRGVDEDPSADGVDLGGHPVHRGQHPGHVRRARHGEQRDAAGVAGELGVEIVLVDTAVRRGADVDHGPAAAPREQVGVVLEDRGQHHRVVGAGHRSGVAVDGLGRVLREHDHIAIGVGPDERPDVSRAASNIAVLRRDL